MINNVTVLGANGTMGARVAAIFAAFGRCHVTMVARKIEAAAEALSVATSSVRADAIAARLTPATYGDLAEHIPASDLVIECVAEDLSVKQATFAQVVPHLRPGTIVASNTSGLPITSLAAMIPEANPFFGTHFYNPPYALPLCEFIEPDDGVDPAVSARLEDYLRTVLRRVVVRTKDTPGFLGNRVGFYLINAAMQIAEETAALGGIDYVDAVFGPFTGRSMPPLVTSDFVGLDVHQQIVDHLLAETDDYAHDAFVFPRFARALVDQGRLGRKAGAGLYKTERLAGGEKRRLVLDLATGDYRPVARYALPYRDQIIAHLRQGRYKQAMAILASPQDDDAELTLRLLVTYAAYGLAVSRLVGEDLLAADAVMSAGFSWAPPAGVVAMLGGDEAFWELAARYLPQDVVGRLRQEVGPVPAGLIDPRPAFRALP